MTTSSTEPRPWSKAGGPWSHELVAYALNRFHRVHLRTPTLRELKAGVDGLPSHATIKRMYGTASAMYVRHGFRVRRAGAQHGARPAVRSRDDAGRFLARTDG